MICDNSVPLELCFKGFTGVYLIYIPSSHRVLMHLKSLTTVYIKSFEQKSFVNLRKSFIVNPLTLCTHGCEAEVSEEKLCISMAIYETFLLRNLLRIWYCTHTQAIKCWYTSQGNAWHQLNPDTPVITSMARFLYGIEDS